MEINCQKYIQHTSQEPAVIAMETLDTQDLETTLKAAVKAANEGVEHTKTYIAKFGRAKSLMGRAIGFQDAGATSVAIIFQAMHQYVTELLV